jgi:hypothetical protein
MVSPSFTIRRGRKLFILEFTDTRARSRNFSSISVDPGSGGRFPRCLS